MLTEIQQINRYLEGKKDVWSKSTYATEKARIGKLILAGFPFKTLPELIKELKKFYRPYSIQQLFTRMRRIDEEVFGGKMGISHFVRTNAAAFRGVYLGRQKNPSREEVDLILKTTKASVKQAYNFIYLMAWAGLRKSEAISAQWGDLNPEQDWIVVRQGKGKKDRIVPFSRAKQSGLVKNDHLQISGGIKYPERWIDTIRDLSGVDFTPHSLRAAALQLYSQVLTTRELQDFAGHSNANTTMRYLTVDKRIVSDKIDKLGENK